MSILNENHKVDPSSDDTSLLEVTPSTPIGFEDVVDAINEIRTRHPGVVGFTKGTLSPDALHELCQRPQKANRNLASCGWHMHGGFYAVNLSLGSTIPTLFARPEDVSRAISDSLMRHIPQLLELDRVLEPVPIHVADLNEKIVEGQSLPIMEHIRRVTERLALGRQSTIDEISQAWNTIRTLFFDFGDGADAQEKFYHQVFLDIIKRSQTGIPGNRVLAMSPKDYDVYVIPPFRPHARSIREGQLYRPAHEGNKFILLAR